MELMIGKTLKALRQKRDLTQEEVAAHLGISFQSVSKWERGEGYPDITMLPALASYFDITVDELLGTGARERKARYEQINRLWEANRKDGRHLENISLMRKALKSFPNDSLLLVQLAASLERADGTPEEKRQYLRESIAVQEQIIRYGDNCEIRGATLFNICFSYEKNGERSRALEQAAKLPNLYKSRENALVCFLDGEGKRAVAKSALLPIAWSAAHHLGVLAETEKDPAYLEKADRIVEILFGEDESEPVEAIRKKIRPR